MQFSIRARTQDLPEKNPIQEVIFFETKVLLNWLEHLFHIHLKNCISSNFYKLLSEFLLETQFNIFCYLLDLSLSDFY